LKRNPNQQVSVGGFRSQALEMAAAFRALRAIPNDNARGFSDTPVIVMGAFATELALKALVVRDHKLKLWSQLAQKVGGRKYLHDLDALFNWASFHSRYRIQYLVEVNCPGSRRFLSNQLPGLSRPISSRQRGCGRSRNFCRKAPTHSRNGAMRTSRLL
jgi:hypothetical protein